MAPEQDFNPRKFLFNFGERRFPIDCTFWAELNNAGLDLYLPQKRAKRGWPSRLKEEYGITEHVYYDSAIVGLPLTLTREQIEGARLGMNRYLIKSAGDLSPVSPPKSITAEQALQYMQIRLYARQSALEIMQSLKESKSAMPAPELTDWEKKVLSWRRGYGFLVPYDCMVGVFLPFPKDESSLKYEVVREYFFQTPDKLGLLDEYFRGIALSIAQEPNSDKAIFGLRRDLRTDWVFGDPRFCDGQTAHIGGMWVNDHVEGGRSVAIEPFVEQMNYLIRNLEEVLAS